jgi:prophage antirepressor-like protein
MLITVTTIIDENGNPWWVAKEVCGILGISNPSKAASCLDGDEKSNVTISNTGNGGRDIRTIINESGLYSLILRSRKPEAKVFKKWVTGEVLPAIRKTGGYQVKEMSETRRKALNYIQNNNEMFMKYRAIFDMLKGGVEMIEKVIIVALHQYNETEGSNKKEMLEGFYLLIEAIERISMVEQKISVLKTKDGFDFLSYIRKLKNEFKKNDLMEINRAAIAEAVKESKSSTFH